ncbi:hypothetical protein B0T17DRAFT_525825 [Bombardia bombarda]|uniref:Ketoreductase domain-containing protein n=1 Tax=Bombardia bombarda TaxID=252184 RepID=A0AA39X916_9PEZI|nr:hypothetical protein B0T17DRAFT_525825 [Bombardia bombarda]
MASVFPNPFPPYHTKAYPAIDPARPELSSKGKSVLITGGGAGIGASIAHAFAKSGAAIIGIVGRRLAVLDATKAAIQADHPGVQVEAITGDITSASSITSAVKLFASKTPSGKIDVLVANAAYLGDNNVIEAADADEYWSSYEINVKGAFNLIRAFGPVSADKGAVVLEISSGAIHLPPLKGISAYQSSKLAVVPLWDHFVKDREAQGIRVVHIQPGSLGTDMGNKAKAQSGATFPLDDIDLPGAFAVWAASDEAAFLNYRFVWANWDVDGLKASKDELSKDPFKFTIGLLGWTNPAE